MCRIKNWETWDKLRSTAKINDSYQDRNAVVITPNQHCILIIGSNIQATAGCDNDSIKYYSSCWCDGEDDVNVVFGARSGWDDWLMIHYHQIIKAVLPPSAYNFQKSNQTTILIGLEESISIKIITFIWLPFFKSYTYSYNAVLLGIASTFMLDEDPCSSKKQWLKQGWKR